MLDDVDDDELLALTRLGVDPVEAGFLVADRETRPWVGPCAAFVGSRRNAQSPAGLAVAAIRGCAAGEARYLQPVTAHAERERQKAAAAQRQAELRRRLEETGRRAIQAAGALQGPRSGHPPTRRPEPRPEPPRDGAAEGRTSLPPLPPPPSPPPLDPTLPPEVARPWQRLQLLMREDGRARAMLVDARPEPALDNGCLVIRVASQGIAEHLRGKREWFLVAARMLDPEFPGLRFRGPESGARAEGR